MVKKILNLLALVIGISLIGTLVFAQNSSVYNPLTTPVTTSNGGTGANLTISKGDLLIGTAAGGLFARLATGTNAYLLTASSTATHGVSWEVAAAGGGSSYNTFEFFLNPGGAATATTTPAASNKKIGTNWTALTLDYSSSTAEQAFWHYRLPTFTALNTCTYEFDSFVDNPSSASGTSWQLLFRPVATDEKWDDTAATTTATTSITYTSVGYIENGSITVATSSLSSKDLMQFRVSRNLDSGDTYTMDARYLGGIIYCTYR